MIQENTLIDPRGSRNFQEIHCSRKFNPGNVLRNHSKCSKKSLKRLQAITQKAPRNHSMFQEISQISGKALSMFRESSLNVPGNLSQCSRKSLKEIKKITQKCSRISLKVFRDIIQGVPGYHSVIQEITQKCYRNRSKCSKKLLKIFLENCSKCFRKSLKIF